MDESGLKEEEMEGIEESLVNRRRQETVSFQLDENEVSFNKYRAIIEDRQSRCYLQTQIDQEVKDMQQKFLQAAAFAFENQSGFAGSA